MKLGDYFVFEWINALGYDNTKWSCHTYFEKVSVKEQTGFGTDEEVEGNVLYIWIDYCNESDLHLFTEKSSKPKYVLKDDGSKQFLVVYEFND